MNSRRTWLARVERPLLDAAGVAAALFATGLLADCVDLVAPVFLLFEAFAGRLRDADSSGPTFSFIELSLCGQQTRSRDKKFELWTSNAQPGPRRRNPSPSGRHCLPVSAARGPCERGRVV